MPKNNFHKINTPLYLYLFALVVCFFLQWLGLFEITEWNTYILGFLVFIAPFLSLFISIYLYRKFSVQRREIKVFLLGAIPGFFPGAVFGYGIWILGHGDTLIGFLSNIMVIGLPTAIVFGLIGSFYDYILCKFHC